MPFELTRPIVANRTSPDTGAAEPSAQGKDRVAQETMPSLTCELSALERKLCPLQVVNSRRQRAEKEPEPEPDFVFEVMARRHRDGG